MVLFQSSCSPTKPTAMSMVVVDSSETCADMLSHDLMMLLTVTGALANRLLITTLLLGSRADICSMTYMLKGAVDDRMASVIVLSPMGK